MISTKSSVIAFGVKALKMSSKVGLNLSMPKNQRKAFKQMVKSSAISATQLNEGLFVDTIKDTLTILAAKVTLLIGPIIAFVAGIYFFGEALINKLKSAAIEFLGGISKEASNKLVDDAKAIGGDKLESFKLQSTATIDGLNEKIKVMEQFADQQVKNAKENTKMVVEAYNSKAKDVSEAAKQIKESADGVIDKLMTRFQQTGEGFSIAYEKSMESMSIWYNSSKDFVSNSGSTITQKFKEADFTLAAMYVAIGAGSLVAFSLFIKWSFDKLKTILTDKILKTDNIEEVTGGEVAAFEKQEAEKDKKYKAAIMKDIKRLKLKVA